MEEKIPTEATQAANEVTARPKKKKKGLLIGIIAAAVVLVLAVAFVIVAAVSGSMATDSFIQASSLENKEIEGYVDLYEDAYNQSRLAIFMSKSDKNTILKKYIVKVLCERDKKYFEAANLVEKSSMVEGEKKELYAANSLLGMCKAGTVVTYGKYKIEAASAATGKTGENADLEWIVLKVEEVDGRVLATLMTKNVIASPGGFSDMTAPGNIYKGSNLEKFCKEVFLSNFDMYNENAGTQNFKTVVISSEGSEDVQGKAYAPSKEDIEILNTLGLSDLVRASATGQAKKEGVLCSGKDRYASYYVRNAGATVNGEKMSSGYDQNGKYVENLSSSSESIGTRVCVVIDLGEK